MTARGSIAVPSDVIVHAMRDLASPDMRAKLVALAGPGAMLDHVRALPDEGLIALLCHLPAGRWSWLVRGAYPPGGRDPDPEAGSDGPPTFRVVDEEAFAHEHLRTAWHNGPESSNVHVDPVDHHNGLHRAGALGRYHVHADPEPAPASDDDQGAMWPTALFREQSAAELQGNHGPVCEGYGCPPGAHSTDHVFGYSEPVPWKVLADRIKAHR